MSNRVSIAALLIAVCCSAAAFALPADDPLPDQAQEARARSLFYEIRCVVCAGESIADSPAGVATDMRREIRRQIAAGESDVSIKAFLTSRYGDGILMRPPLKSSTWLLWSAPIMILGLALLLARKCFRPRA